MLKDLNNQFKSLVLICTTVKYNFITIEGNIGAGKTTLSKILSEYYGAKLILEEFADNPFLPDFYKNPAQYAFPLELFFMAERYKQLSEMLQSRDMFHQITVSDYLFKKSLLFAKVNLPEQEYRLYQKLFDIINPQIIQPDILIYLHAPVDKLKENIKKRNRSYEQNIDPQYLHNLQDIYSAFIKQHKIKTLFVDASEADFVNNPNHLKIITEALEQDWQEGPNYISLNK